MNNSINYLNLNLLKSDLVDGILIITMTLIFNFILKYLIKKLYNNKKSKKSTLNNSMIEAMLRPTLFFLWAVALTSIARLIEDNIQKDFTQEVLFLRILLLSICIMWFFFRFVNQYKLRFINIKKMKNEKIDNLSISALEKLLKAIILIVGLLFIFQHIGIDLAGILAFGGVSGIFIGFASKDLLSNLFGFVMLHINRSFAVGDSIVISGKNIEGKVKSIEWRQTKLINNNQAPIYIPNSIFNEVIIENKSRASNIKLLEIVSIEHKYINKIDKIIEDIEDMLKKSEEVNKKFDICVYLKNFDSYFLNISIEAIINTGELIKYNKIKHNILIKIQKIIVKNNAGFIDFTSIVKLEK